MTGQTGFPIHDRTPVRFADALPGHADVVVIGGGVIGAAVALYAAGRGLSVVLCEKGRIAGEQSSRNWGWVRQQGRDAHELPIVTEAMALWRDLAARAPGIGFRQTGVVYLAADEAELARYEAWLEVARAGGIDSRLLTGAGAAALISGAARGWAGALHTPSDGRAEPWTAVPAIAALAQAEGVRIAEGCAVRCLDIAAGRVAGVVTEKGRIGCDQVVLAGGAWSALLLRHHGVFLPQLSVRESVAATAPLPGVFAGAASEHALSFRRREDGGYTLAPRISPRLWVGPDALRSLRWYLPQLRRDPFGTSVRPFAPRGFPDHWATPRGLDPDRPGPFEAMRILDPAPDRRALERMRAAFQALFPALGEVRLTATWAGMIDTLPDIVPAIGPVARLPGLILATGMSGHGFGIGPGVGRVVADLLAGRAPGHDLSRFDPARFDGPIAVDFGAAL
ncbi:MAG: FAD-binding oxidoreductase [Gemmobacter sp.]